MADFTKYYPTLVQHESEKFSDHSDDPGGPTKVGITLKTLQGQHIDLDGDGDCDVQDLKMLDKKRAMPVYKRVFWDPLGLDGFRSQNVAEIVFDFGVNSGQVRATLMVKYLLNRYFKGNWLLTPRVTPEYIAAVNAADQRLLFGLVVDFRRSFYLYRATKLRATHPLVPYFRLSLTQGGMGLSPSPKALTFIGGWLNRINSFKFVA